MNKKNATWVASGLLLASGLASAQGAFSIEEATIDDTHKAIQEGRITCKGVVQAYLDRVKAYNGTCTALVTADGKPIKAAKGIVRAGKPLAFPTKTVAASTYLPDLDQYQGLPLEYGRMEATISDPGVQQQFGMRVGIPNAGQVNALETLNIRGERSVTCKGKFDTHPSAGPLPKGAPAACEEFRKQPDALERAAELDKKYGAKPDLEALPMYCVTFAWKNWYDAKDMRSTGGNDVNFAMDAPSMDSPDVANIRAKGAISLGVANAAKAAGSAPGTEKAKSILLADNLAYGAWGGQPCNPYDTTRVPRGSSSGSAVAVSANFAACSICEQTGGSCKGPASRSGIVNLLTTKGILMDGGYGYQKIGDRAGINCRTVADTVKVLDAAKGYETSDPYTALPKAMIPKEPYSSFLVAEGEVAAKPLKDMRIAVVRSFMIKHTKNDEAISDQIDAEIKAVLRDKLGAQLVESTDPKYPDDSSIPNLKYSFEDAFREILPSTAPEFFWQKNADGSLEFAVPGWDVTSVKYLTALALGKAPLSEKINLRRIAKKASQYEGPLGWNRYLATRGDARVFDWTTWIANSKFDSDSARAGAVNLLNVKDARVKPDTISYIKMHSVLRMIVLKVMRENGIDAFVNPEQTTPPYKLGMGSEPEVDWRESNGCCQAFTAMMGAPEMEVPAGYTQVAYEPGYVLSADKKEYVATTGAVKSELPYPMPISLMIWAGPGDEPAMIKLASAYEAATRHRKPPPDFGPLEGPPGERAAMNKSATNKSTLGLLLVLAVLGSRMTSAADGAFQVEEATIAGTHKAIQDGAITCQGVVKAYIDRIKAYNGTCTALVTADGKPVKSVPGRILGGSKVAYPTKTVGASTFIPDLDQYQGLPIEYGRMEPTMSDPGVQQQWGMRVGIPDAGGVNAIETLNIRGERSVTCKARCDAATGALPASCPKACDAFRKQPDALERAAELDKQYGTKPDLAKYPLYCVAFVWKNWYDATDMRGTGGNDANFAMDAPKHDSPDVAQARAAGAISLAMTNAAKAANGDNGPVKPKGYFVGNNLAYAAWGGQPCNPYDTERIPRGSTSGSGVAIAANLGACSFCEQSGGSCMGPASRNGIVSILTTKGVLMDGGYGYQSPGDRAGIYCRTVADAVKVLDVVKGFETTDIYSALPKSIIPKESYESFLLDDSSLPSKPLTGMRIAIPREFMVKHAKNDAAISDQIDKEIKTALRDKLGATLVESVDPLYPDDASVPNLKYSFQDAIREIFPVTVPEYFAQKTANGELEFAVPGWDVTSADYLTALTLGKAPLSPKLTLRRTFKSVTHVEGSFGWDLYLGRRGDERIKDWASWVPNAKFDSEQALAQAINAVNTTDARAKPGTISYLKMQLVLRMVVLKVMRENDIDAFVNPENTLPPFKLGRASEPAVNNRDSKGVAQTFSAVMGAPEIQIPAGFNEIVYEPKFVLSADKKSYEEVTGDVAETLRHPMPISLTVWGAPGDEPTLIKIASAYEAATHHRKAPPMFPPLTRKP